jgi:alpha-tubulin suppressor-like RCC1 family protein
MNRRCLDKDNSYQTMSAFYSASIVRRSWILCLLLVSANIAHSQNVTAWGSSLQGQTNTSDVVTNPVTLVAGAFHCLALNADGTVVAWGKNWDGQTNVPPSATNVVAIAAGAAHSLALSDDGSVIAWGRNWDGQTNVPPTVTNVVAIAAGQAHSVALRADGTVVAWGSSEYGQASVSFLATRVIAIAAGYYHTLALLADHTVVSWGSQDSVPSSATNVVAIAGGFEHSVALKADGTVVAWGDNTFGQTNVPASATNIVAITTAWYHTLALKADGTVVAWGTGYYGVTNIPSGLTNIVNIATGEDCSAATARSGDPVFGLQLTSAVAHLYSPARLNVSLQGSYPLACQWFHDGVAVLDATNAYLVLNSAQPSDTGNYMLVASNSFGLATNQPILLTVSPTPSMTALVGAWGDNVSGTCDISPAIADPRAIAAGSGHCLVLQGDGSVIAWGDNSFGQTDVPGEATNVVSIAAGDYHSLALRADGVLLAWGRNDFGQTNVPIAATNTTSIAAGMGHSVAMRSDGVIVAWGRNYEHETDVPMLLAKAVTVASGCYHTLALLSDHTVVSWGLLDSVPSSATNVVAIAGGFEHSLALKADGTVLAWGDNTFGQTNVPASATNIVAIAAGHDHSLALRTDGALIAWGLGYYGSTNIPPHLGNVASIAARGDYNLAVVRLGTPQFSPQLAPVETHTGREVVLSGNIQGPYPLTYQWLHNGNIVAGATNWFLWLPACQAADAGDYVLVATNAFGQASSQPMNLVVHTDPETFTAVGAWGDNTSGQCAVPQGVANPRAIAAGAYHALALTADGTVAAWGKNRDGQTNVPPEATNTVAVAAGGSHSMALRDDGSVIAWGANWDGQTNVPSAATNVVAIAAGCAHSLALRGDGTVLAWGNNEFHQTDVPSLAAGAIAIAAGYFHNLALLSDHTVVAWGLQNSVPASATNVVAISGGWWHSLALRADGSVVAWGDNAYGQCTVPSSATNVIGIAAGYYHSLVLLANGKVIAWGAGINGVTNVPTGLGNVARIAAGRDYSLVMMELGFPRFSSSSQAVVSHVGGKARFVPEVSGTSPLAFQWYHDGASIEGATNRCLLLTNVPLSSAGTYTLVAGNVTGLTNWLNSSLDVQSAPAVAGNPAPQNVMLGTHLCLSAEVSGQEPMSLQWRLNGADVQDGSRLSGAANRVLCLEGAKSEDSGSYSLVASNVYGLVTGLVAQVSVSSIIAWGDNSAQQLNVPVGTADVVSIAAGGDHSLALRADDSIVPWGDNSSGQSNVPRPSGNIVAIADGGDHSLALRSDGLGLVWGQQVFYPYGQSNIVGFPQPVVAMAAGESHSLALLLDGTVAAWGSNYSLGWLPVPASATNVVAIAAGDGFSLAVKSDGALVCWGALPPAPDDATNVVAVAAGGKHALALRADGLLLAWGGNYFGQASVPDFVTNAVAIAAGGDNSLALLANGRVVGWGADYYGRSSTPPSATNVLAISAGAGHNLALAGNGTQRPMLQPFNQSVTVGQSVLLNAGSPMGSVASYQWQLNGIDLAGATNVVLAIPFATWTNPGLYRVVVSNGFGSVTGPPTMLSVLRTPLYFDTSPGGILMSNDGTHLRVLGASGVGPVVILASSDLQAWEPILTNPPVIGAVEFLDPEVGSLGARLYRALEGAVSGPLRIDIEPLLSQTGSAAPPLQLTGLTASGPVIIYASSNLLDWSAVFTNPPTVGPLQYREALPSDQPLRFYRASEDRRP